MSDNFTKQTIQRGATPNDGTGDTLRAASGKINNNFDDVYHKLGNEEELMIDIKYENDAIGNILSPKKNQILKFDDVEKKFIPKDYIEQTNFTIKDGDGQSFDVSLLDNETDDSKDDRQNDIVIKGGVGISVRYEDPRQLIFDGFDWDYNSLDNKQFIEDNFAELFTKIGDGNNQCILDVRSDTPLVTGDILKYDAFSGKFIPAKDVDTTNFSISNGTETTNIFLNQNQGMNDNSLTITGNNIGVTVAEQQLILDGFDGNFSSLQETDFIKENFAELYENLGTIDPLYEVDGNGNFVYETEMIDKVDENGDPVMIQAKNEDGDDLFNQDGTPLMVQDKEEVNVEDADGNPIKIPKTDSSGEPLFSYKTIINTRNANEGDTLKLIDGKFVSSKSKFNLNNIEVSDDKTIQITSDVGVEVSTDPDTNKITLNAFDGEYESLNGKEFIDNKLGEIYQKIGFNGESLNIDIAGAVENHVLKFDGTNFVPSPDNSTVFNLMDSDNTTSTIKDNGTVIFEGSGGVSVKLNPDNRTITIDTTETIDAIEALQDTVNDNVKKIGDIGTEIATLSTTSQSIETELTELSPRIQEVEERLQYSDADTMQSVKDGVDVLKTTLSLDTDDLTPAEGSFLKYIDGKYKPTEITIPEDVSGELEQTKIELEQTKTVLDNLEKLVDKLADPIENIKYRLRKLDGTTATVDDGVKSGFNIINEKLSMGYTMTNFTEEGEEHITENIGYFWFDENEEGGIGYTTKESDATSIDDSVWPLQTLTLIYERVNFIYLKQQEEESNGSNG